MKKESQLRGAQAVEGKIPEGGSGGGGAVITRSLASILNVWIAEREGKSSVGKVEEKAIKEGRGRDEVDWLET